MRYKRSIPLYIVDSATGCWEWQRAKTRHGYGLIRVDGRLVYAHRWLYEQHKGPIPEGTELDHVVCQHPPCCNPDHVEPVPHAVNSQRGRVAKITMETAREIRRLAATFRQCEVARMLGVPKHTVHEVVAGKTWRE